MIATITDLNNSLVRQVRAKVELYEGSTLLTTYNYTDRLKSIQVERVGEENKFFGFGICQKLNIHLVDKDRELSFSTANSIKVYFSHNDETEYYCNFPVFHITEVHRDEKTNELSITAYDKLYWAAAHTVFELDTLQAPYTVDDFAAACAELLGATGIHAINVNGNSLILEYLEGANYGGEETIREALTHVAEMSQSIYYMDCHDRLIFKRLNATEPTVEINKEKYITLKVSNNRRLSTIIHTTELGDNVSATTGASGTTQYVRDNPFWDLREDIDNLVEEAINFVGGLTIAQFDCSWRGDYRLEIGDNITIITKDDAAITSYVLNDIITYDGKFKQRTQWKHSEDEATNSNPSTLGEVLKQTYAKVDKANKQIDIVASEVLDNKENISAINVNIDNMSLSVSESLEGLEEKVSLALTKEQVKIEIEERIDEGVEKVETATGFTFDDEGLKIEKTGSEMSTQITEDGMTVSKNGSVMLTANNQGVDAVNLSATTYLIVGRNSRFEDYGYNRTGCFWIGG